MVSSDTVVPVSSRTAHFFFPKASDFKAGSYSVDGRSG